MCGVPVWEHYKGRLVSNGVLYTRKSFFKRIVVYGGGFRLPILRLHDEMEDSSTFEEKVCTFYKFVFKGTNKYCSLSFWYFIIPKNGFRQS